MGTNSEDQCNAASFFLVANPNVPSVRPPRKPGLFSPHLQATDGNSRGSGGRSAALRSRDKPSLHKPRGDRDDSTQCPLSVAPGPRPREDRVLILGFLPLAAEMVRCGVWGQTPRRNECTWFCSLAVWPKLGEGRDGGHPGAEWACAHASEPARSRSWTVPTLECLPRGAWQGPHRVWAPYKSFPSHRFRVVQPSASWLKLLISPANVYYPFYLMHYYVLILHETERKRLSDSLAPKGRFLYIVPPFHCFLLLLLSF